ncbi:hypothetical protein [Pseudomonas sp. Eqa60]|uniref:hypothetical protein n=1 Tax=Pseudomonas sp. Eqa60 TaxID=2799184 RepID=UPI001BB36FFE|nr:hypothetical protein [Pseudomonas sp. Eqa60]
MRILIWLAVALTLGGCVGPGDLERNDPSLRLSTKKDPKSYALCVFPKWQNARNDSSMSETESGYRLLVASAMADELLEIRKTSSGSDVTLYQRMAWSAMPGRSAIESAVKSCL